MTAGQGLAKPVPQYLNALKVMNFLRRNAETICVNVVSGLMVATVLYFISFSPPIFGWLKSKIAELKTASYDPSVIAPLQEKYLREKQPEKVIAVSQDIITVAPFQSNEYRTVKELREKAYSMMGRVSVVGADTVTVATGDQKREL